MDGIGVILSQSIHRGLYGSSDMIDRLLRHVNVLPYHEAPKPQGGLSGESFVFTGAMSMKRADAQKWVRDNGGDTPDSVNANTTYLVLGNPDFQQYLNGVMSSKTKAAKKLKEKGSPIKIISETMFVGFMDEFA
jgi:NAD-dependent DNA ligase